MKQLVFIAGSLLVLLQVKSQEISPARGHELFVSHCAACHSIARDVVGPALKDVDKRRSIAWIQAFVHSSQSVIKSGDSVAARVFAEHNRTVMPDQPDLSDADVLHIVAYIKQESMALALQPVSAKGPDEPVPYYGKSNALHQLVFLDIPGEHQPLSPRDYFAWGLIALMVLTLVIILLVAVKTQAISTHQAFEKPSRSLREEQQ